MAGVTIPQYEQQVGVSDVAQPRAQFEPSLPSPVGAGLDAIGQQLLNISIVQVQHQKALDLTNAVNGFKTAQTQAQIDAADQPGTKQVQFFRDKVAKLTQSYTDDPANSHIAEPLKLELARMNGEADREMMLRSATATREEQQYGLKSQIVQTGTMTGPMYTASVGKDGKATFTPTPDAIDLIQRQAATIDQVYPPDAKPNENNAFKAELAQTVMLQRATAIALRQPDKLTDFLDKAQVPISTTDEINLMNIATTAQRSGMKNIDTGYDVKRANILNEFDSGKMSPGALLGAANNKDITEEDYTRRAHVPFVGGSYAPMVQQVQTLIDTAKTPEDLLAADVLIKSSRDTIQGKELGALNAKLAQKRQHLNTEYGKSEATAMGMLDRYYSMSTDDEHDYNADAPVRLNDLKDRAKNQFNSLRLGAEAAKLPDLMQKAIDANPVDMTILSPAPVKKKK